MFGNSKFKSKLATLNSDLLRHTDTFTVDQSENLIVVHNGVHTLDPQRIYRTIKQYPLFVGSIF